MFPQRFLVVIGVLAALPWNASFAWGMPQDEDFFKRGNKPPFIKKPAKAEDLITFKIAVEPTQVRRGEIAKVTVTGIPAPGAYTYPLTKRAAGQKESGLVQDLVFETPPGLKALWPVSESEPELEFVPVEKTNYLKHKKPFTWTRDVLVLPDAEPGRKTLVVKTKGLQVCNDRTCIPADQELRTEIDVTDAPAVELSAETAKRLEEERPAVGVVGKLDNGDTPQPRAPVTPPLAAAFPIDQSTAEYQTALSAIQQQIQAAKKDAPPVGLLVFVLQGFFWGAVSLITPCVFPLIPITVSFFLKQSEKQHYRPVTLAIVYCLTIVIVLTISAVTLLAVFQELSIHPATNFLIGGLFVFFALSLFGMYDIELGTGRQGRAARRHVHGADFYHCQLRLRGAFPGRVWRHCRRIGYYLDPPNSGRPGVLGHLCSALLHSGAVSDAPSALAQERLLAQQRQSGYGFPRVSRRAQVLSTGRIEFPPDPRAIHLRSRPGNVDRHRNLMRPVPAQCLSAAP
jgi:hypothetical protein